MRNNLVVVVPNVNGIAHLQNCLESLQKQTLQIEIMVVDNGSHDGSAAYIEKNFPQVKLIKRSKNYGFTGGVNPGMQWAIDNDYKYVAPFNNDAIADKHWATELLKHVEAHPHTGIATSKITDIHGKHLDSTGEFYTSWGLPFARGRGELDKGQYDKSRMICAASGGASIYRVSMLKEIGIFDQDFFAYYEDVDISLRAQLAGWQIEYVPTAVVRHHIGATSGKIKGFTTYQTMKNLLWVAIKNVPSDLLSTVLPRLLIAHAAFFGKAIARGNWKPAIKGLFICYFLIPKKLGQRRFIQRSATHKHRLRELLYYDLPPDATNLRKLRSKWWRISGKREDGVGI